MRTLRVLHITEDADGAVGSALRALLCDGGIESCACADVYRGLTRLLRAGDFGVVVVDVDGLSLHEFEFFARASFSGRGWKIWAYSPLGRSDRLLQARAFGADEAESGGDLGWIARLADSFTNGPRVSDGGAAEVVEVEAAAALVYESRRLGGLNDMFKVADTVEADAAGVDAPLLTEAEIEMLLGGEREAESAAERKGTAG